ncbi:hypothetical protein CS542_05195 [Pedobacter sp. IW39]|nr:hypothetical protein CS542_05195 [Pedobacter sp. IW39]
MFLPKSKLPQLTPAEDLFQFTGDGFWIKRVIFLPFTRGRNLCLNLKTGKIYLKKFSLREYLMH